MKHLRRIPPVILPILLVLAGLAAVLSGVYLLAGAEAALIAGGSVTVLAGLLVDV